MFNTYFQTLHAADEVQINLNPEEISERHHRLQVAFDQNKEGIKDSLKNIKDKDVVIFLGSTGVGKSAVINWLAGKELRFVDRRVVLVDEDDSEAMKIGHDQSTTRYPVSILVNDMCFVDLPGLDDTGDLGQQNIRSQEQDIMNAACINAVMKDAKSLKFIILTSENNITDGNRGGLFVSFIDRLRGVFGENYQPICDMASLILVTKSQSNSIEEAKRFLFEGGRVGIRERVSHWIDNDKLFHMCTPTVTSNVVEDGDKDRILSAVKNFPPYTLNRRIDIGKFFDIGAKTYIIAFFWGAMKNHLNTYTQQEPGSVDECESLIQKFMSEFNFWQSFQESMDKAPEMALLKPVLPDLYGTIFEKFKEDHKITLKQMVEVLQARKKQLLVEQAHRREIGKKLLTVGEGGLKFSLVLAGLPAAALCLIA